jgi:hypothetical protein
MQWKVRDYMKVNVLCVLVFTAALVTSSAVRADAQQATSQVLTFTGAMPGQPDGPVTLRLRLFPVATGGAHVFEETQNVMVAAERFTVRIGDVTVNGVPATTFRDNPSLWIAFALDTTPDTEIGARTAMTSGGYAHAAALVTGPSVRTLNDLVGDVTLAAGPSVTITPSGNTLTIDASAGLTAVSRDATLMGNGTSGSPLGVAAPLQLLASNGTTISGANSSGQGVQGRSSSNTGVSGISDTGVGVSGTSNSGNVGDIAAVQGIAFGNGGKGVFGFAGFGGNGVGVAGRSTGGGRGVVGESLFGAGVGVWGETTSPTDGTVGALGFASAANGRIFGVWGETRSTGAGAAGVLGLSTATTGGTNGVWGESHSPAGVGGTFINLGGGDALQAQNNLRQVVFSVTNSGTTITKVLQIQGGADVSEQFDVGASEQASGRATRDHIEPGMVVSIDPARPGKLLVSRTAYDRRAVGVISGAGGVQPGLMLGQEGSVAAGAHPVALSGRVYCWADASHGAIRPGDLLTTSSTPGHAMKVINHAKAQSAVIGKAMTGLTRGKGLVLVLVSLQ